MAKISTNTKRSRKNKNASVESAVPCEALDLSQKGPGPVTRSRGLKPEACKETKRGPTGTGGRAVAVRSVKPVSPTKADVSLKGLPPLKRTFAFIDEGPPVAKIQETSFGCEDQTNVDSPGDWVDSNTGSTLVEINMDEVF
ncbi:hypothetical protein RhiJN_27100 [Ceratobasidium sp. AG-Ba]|nr:hypothetical protein RhiJN_27100 [Ceratobasidium sp. AG-Ba]